MKLKKLILVSLAVSFIAITSYAGIMIYNPLNLGKGSDLTTPSATRQYPLGTKISVWDDTYPVINDYVYVKAKTGAFAANALYIIDVSSITGSEVMLSTQPATAGTINKPLGVTNAAIPSGYCAWVQTKGYCLILSTNCTQGNTGGAGRGSNRVVDSGGVVVSTSTVGVYKITSQGLAAKPFFLMGREAGAK